MNMHNEHGIEPGTYRHHKGGLFVLTDLVTHLENQTTGDMEELPHEKKLIVYRDLQATPRHVNGKPITPHQVYSMSVEDFFKTIDGKPRFTKI